MTFQDKKKAAEAMLAAAGIGRNAYAPPLYRWMWALGLNVPPPHFAGYVANTVVMSAWFILAVGALRMMLEAGLALLTGKAFDGSAIVQMSTGFLPLGLLFGPIWALYYVWSAHKHRLPRWRDLA